VKFRVDDLKSEIAVCELASMKEKLQNRVAQLEGKLAMIYIGANSEVELKEKKDRLDDALEATRAAIEEGIVPGAGMTLLRISERHLGKKHHDNKDINAGVLSVMYAIRTLAHAILDNAGLDSKNIIATLIAEYGLNDGFNPISEKYVNLITEGIIDPVKVTRLAVKNACSIAGMIITTGCIVYKPNENE
jgi:chaperonin GroEL